MGSPLSSAGTCPSVALLQSTATLSRHSSWKIVSGRTGALPSASSKPVFPRLNSPDGSQILRTVIRFSVSVPVLSVRMTVVAPSVSTADRRSIKAFLRAIRHMPRASASVATMGKPSGIAATASAMAASTIRKASLPCSSPIPPINAVRASVSQTSCPDSNASFFSRGDASGSASATSLEM